MRFATIPLLLLCSATSADAHRYEFGPLEILHPAVMVPSAKMDCSCAHVKIVNRGDRTEFFLGAEINAASRTHLVSIARDGGGLTMPLRVAIAPGATLDLNRHEWCLFMSGITTSLEANFGAIPGTLQFERQGTVKIEFMIDAASH
jgi:copper(I)-binding protein